MDLTNKDLKVVIDDNQLKQHRFVPGKRIIIKNSTYLKNLKSAYIIILAWNFFDSIKIKCKKINKNLCLFRPFPIPKIVKY